MNKKIIIIILLMFMSAILLNSCSFGGGRMLITDDSDKRADARLEKILNALSTNDNDALKAMFSKRALDEADDFDDSMEYLFAFFQGAVKSWKRTGFTAPMKVEYGKKSVQLISWYTVVTDKETFKFLVIDYSVDTFNSDNVGLYNLRVIKEVDEDTQLNYSKDTEIAGIYRPEE
jgi:hypothetical protein